MSNNNSDANSLSRLKSRSYDHSNSLKLDLDNESTMNDNADQTNKPKDLATETTLFKEAIIANVLPLQAINELQPIAIIIELGSNKDSVKNLMETRHIIEAMSSTSLWSTEFNNPDYTATSSSPKPDYTNQCGYLTFSMPNVLINKVLRDNNYFTSSNSKNDLEKLTISDITKLTKAIEKEIQRSNYSENSNSDLGTESLLNNNKQVMIDIDLLAVKTDKGIVAIKERYPFKRHEWVGIAELFEAGVLS